MPALAKCPHLVSVIVCNIHTSERMQDLERRSGSSRNHNMVDKSSMIAQRLTDCAELSKLFVIDSAYFRCHHNDFT